MLGFFSLASAPFGDDGERGVALAPLSITTVAPVLGSPTVAQAHSLTPAAIVTGAVVLGSVTLGERYNLSATGLTTGFPVVGAASLASIHNLIARPIETGAPEFSSVLFSQTSLLTANGLLLGQPFAGNPNLYQYNLGDLQVNYSRIRTIRLDLLSQETRVSSQLQQNRVSPINTREDSRVIKVPNENRTLKL